MVRRSAPFFLSCFEGEQPTLVLDVEDSFVVAWEVVFKNEAFAPRKLHMHKRRVCIRMKLKCTMGQPWAVCMGFHSSAQINVVWKLILRQTLTYCRVVLTPHVWELQDTSLLSCLLLQCLRSTESWSPSCAPSWSPGPPSRSWSRGASSERGYSAATWENTSSIQDMMVSIMPTCLWAVIFPCPFFFFPFNSVNSQIVAPAWIYSMESLLFTSKVPQSWS